ncbi:MAG TPA: DUF6622 family protein [Noviherbaspirillum sp.]|uniref:DUF6622 family protein n=1 Tax=Noviherbaspirillum sp. TaxID=1926288 RepID=UPI002D518B49|nr:DUF6622 family protein [Noviherbaspirillum sp.]HYD94770.1 DUF6622 family protein [Noviherbaspirillum sp.]
MLLQLIVKTPLWVWPLFVFLVYRGVVAGADREAGVTKVFLMPLAMLGLTVQGIAAGFGAHPAAAPVWLACTVAGAAGAWLAFDDRSVVPHPERGSVALRGSWTPLALILAIFLTKYAVNAALAMRPELKEQLVFVATACALYGVFNGVFLGQMLKIAIIFRKGVASAKNFL